MRRLWHLAAIAFASCLVAFYLTQPAKANLFTSPVSPVFTPTSPPVTTTVPVEGKSYTTNDGVWVVFPSGAITQSTVVTYVAGTVNPTGDKTSVGRFFEFSATQGGKPVTRFSTPISFSVPYPQSYLVRGDNIYFYWLDGTEWVTSGLTTVVDPNGQRIIGYTDHFTTFALLGTDKMVYLPLMFKLY